MPVIKILPEELANKIAAGEVIERPASVVKELLENSIDAGAAKIFVQARGEGWQEIVVTDNGSGMVHDDVLLSIERHATSKIKDSRELFSIRTLGFRGEALPSIAAVSHFEITSCARDEIVGHTVRVEGGVIKNVLEASAPAGTTIKVARLFYNTPVRLKFLKPVSTELDHVTLVIIRLALGHPEIHFRFWHEGKEILDFPPTGSLEYRLQALWGRSVIEHLHPVRFDDENGLHIHGYLSPPDVSRSNSRHVYTYVNSRWVSDALLRSAVLAGYKAFLTKGRYPLAALFLELDPGKVDVNVHPTKNEVRFSDSRRVFETFRKVVYEALLLGGKSGGVVPREVPEVYAFDAGRRDGPIREHPLPGYERISEPAFPKRPSSPIQPETEVLAGERSAPAVLRIVHGYPPEERESVSSAWITPLAQLDDSYILCQSADGLVIVDQHAAHERIMYEKFKEMYNSHGVDSQGLLIPELMELSRPEFNAIMDYSDRLKRLGLTVEPFGENTIAVKTVPSLATISGVREMIMELIDALAEAPASIEETELLDRVLATVACHGSIRARQGLSREEMVRLIEDINGLSGPLHCPHGRPISMKIGFEQIARELKRR